MATSFIAGLATLPFALYHFDRISVYGVLANAIAVPLTGFVIMPAAALALILMPFGLESWPLAAMGWGCDALLAVARWVAGWPGAVALVPAPAVSALPLFAIGLLWLGLVRGLPRWVGLTVLLAGLSTAWLAERPDLLVASSGKLIAFRTPEGALMLSAPRAERLVRETWLRRNGQKHADDLGDLTDGEDWLRCGERGCDYGTGAKIRVLLGDVQPTIADCTGVVLVIAAAASAAPDCTGIATITKADLLARGALAIYLDGAKPRIEAASDRIGRRPWAATVTVGESDMGEDGAGESEAPTDQ